MAEAVCQMRTYTDWCDDRNKPEQAQTGTDTAGKGKGKGKVAKRKRKWRFTLLPEPSYQSQYILVDTKCLLVSCPSS